MVDVKHEDGERALAAVAAGELFLKADLHEMAVEEAGERVANGLLLELETELERGDGDADELHHLAEGVKALVGGLLDGGGGHLDGEDADSLAAGDHGKAEIGRGLLAGEEVQAVDLGLALAPPAEGAGAQSAAGAWGEEVRECAERGSGVVACCGCGALEVAPVGDGFDEMAGVVDHAERSAGAWKELGDAAGGDGIDLIEGGAELEFVADGGEELGLDGLILERGYGKGELLIDAAVGAEDFAAAECVAQQEGEEDQEDEDGDAGESEVDVERKCGVGLRGLGSPLEELFLDLRHGVDGLAAREDRVAGLDAGGGQGIDAFAQVGGAGLKRGYARGLIGIVSDLAVDAERCGFEAKDGGAGGVELIDIGNGTLAGGEIETAVGLDAIDILVGALKGGEDLVSVLDPVGCGDEVVGAAVDEGSSAEGKEGGADRCNDDEGDGGVAVGGRARCHRPSVAAGCLNLHSNKEGEGATDGGLAGSANKEGYSCSGSGVRACHA